MRTKWVVICVGLLFLIAAFVQVSAENKAPTQTSATLPLSADDPSGDNARKMLEDGQTRFRLDTFGDEVFCARFLNTGTPASVAGVLAGLVNMASVSQLDP
jgi:hypothetical protein